MFHLIDSYYHKIYVNELHFYAISSQTKNRNQKMKTEK